MSEDELHDDPLAATRLFADLSEEIRETVRRLGNHRHVTGGEWVFRAGEPAAAMYVVLSGRLEVVAEEPEPEIFDIGLSVSSNNFENQVVYLKSHFNIVPLQHIIESLRHHRKLQSNTMAIWNGRRNM